ncbi:hypothetical protein BH11BAC1_BH11BAC1_07150 [soil metagenome]
MFDFDDAESIVTIGYKYAMKYKNEIEKIGLIKASN